MRKVELVFYSDPGHGWLQVPLALIKELGIELNISRYSYKSAEFAYLEEDCDVSVFMKAAESRGIEVKITDESSNHDSVIRQLTRFRDRPSKSTSRS